MAYETIRYEHADGILTLTLDRPERLNAFTMQMCRELLDAFDRADRDDDVRAVIVTGAGRAFCAGADLSGGAATFDRSVRRDEGALPLAADGTPDLTSEAARDGGGRLTLRIFSCLKPVIAAVNGPAVGIGMTMQLPMDVRLASEDARFGFVFVRRGVVPEACSSWFLPRLVGISRALEWSLSGRVFSAREAFEGGLVRAVHPAAELLPAAQKLAREFADNSAVSVALTRQMMWRMLGAQHPMAAHRIDSRAMIARGQSPDANEGIASFLEKRAPKFTDRVSTDMPAFFPWWTEPEYE
jgi:enoyl-CoA hydratase/carnithine racemase